MATVKSHIGRILSKLHARDRAQLVIVAYERPAWSPPGHREPLWKMSPPVVLTGGGRSSLEWRPASGAGPDQPRSSHAHIHRLHLHCRRRLDPAAVRPGDEGLPGVRRGGGG